MLHSTIKVDIRQLILGYLVIKSSVQEEVLDEEIIQIIQQLDSKNIFVEFRSKEEIELLLDYWKENNFIEQVGKIISLSKSRKKYINLDFVKNKLFDVNTDVADEVINVCREVVYEK